MKILISIFRENSFVNAGSFCGIRISEFWWILIKHLCEILILVDVCVIGFSYITKHYFNHEFNVFLLYNRTMWLTLRSLALFLLNFSHIILISIRLIILFLSGDFPETNLRDTASITHGSIENESRRKRIGHNGGDI